ncbi:MAG TPA: hypothetical protein ENF77_05410 [Candidatus Acetothermia bacterium]|nr:hypothetical protein [Candidatus Acetothermia bacterium]
MYDLAFLPSASCKVTVYDVLSQPGGMLRVGIPTFRLPEELDDLRRESDAVVLTLRAWRDRRLGIPGEDAEGCFGCLEFLQGVREGRIRRLEGRVFMVGGGNAAVDSARAASLSPQSPSPMSSPTLRHPGAP